MKTNIDLEVNAKIPRIGAPNSKAVFAFMTMWIPVPYERDKRGLFIRQGHILGRHFVGQIELILRSHSPQHETLQVGTFPLAHDPSQILFPHYRWLSCLQIHMTLPRRCHQSHQLPQDFLVGIVAAEKLRFCEIIISLLEKLRSVHLLNERWHAPGCPSHI